MKRSIIIWIAMLAFTLLVSAAGAQVPREHRHRCSHTSRLTVARARCAMRDFLLWSDHPRTVRLSQCRRWSATRVDCKQVEHDVYIAPVFKIAGSSQWFRVAAVARGGRVHVWAVAYISDPFSQRL